MLLLVLCAGLSDAARADHLDDSGELKTKWVRHGFNEGYSLAAADMDGDGNEEILYGGRKIAVLDEEAVQTGIPRSTVAWSHVPANQLDGGDNSWVTGMEVDGDSLYVTSSDTDAYRIDLRSGAKRWHVERTGWWFSHGFALFDGPDDDVPDVFPTGGTASYSGQSGEVLWQSPSPRAAKFALSAELDGAPGRDVAFAVDPSGVAIGQESVFAVSGSGQKLGGFIPNSIVESLAVADLDADGIDEIVVGTGTGMLYAVGADGVLRWVGFPGPGKVAPIAVANIDGDAGDEVIAGYRTPTENNEVAQVVAYDNTGVHLWRHVVGLPVATLEPMQLDTDPAPELVVGAGTYLQLDTAGVAVGLETGVGETQRERWRVAAHQQVMSAIRTEHAGEPVVLLGSADAILRAVDPTTGVERWRYSAGGYVFATAAGDVDGDGVDEVAKSGEDGVVLLVDDMGRERWSREVDVDDHGIIRGLAMGDVDGDGEAEVAVAGTRYAAEQGGVVEVYDGDGTRLWSTLLSGASEDVEIADLDGDGLGEVVAGEAAGLDAECAVNAFEPLTGAVRWRTPISACLVPAIDIGNVDADSAPEIAYGDRTLASQPHLALLEANGSTTWNQGITDQVFWIQAIPGGLVHGGFTFGQLGAITRRDAAGVIRWHTSLPDDEQFKSASRFAALVPTDGESFSIAASADDGAVYFLDGQNGAIVWGTRLEPKELEFADRHPAGPIVLLPAHGAKDPRLVVGQYRTGRRRAATFALDLEGRIVGSAPMEGEAQAATVLHRLGGRALAVVGAGLGLYAFEA